MASDFGARSRLGIYVHVPFCPHICPYCDFVKTARFSRKDVESYFLALEKQFDTLVASVPADLKTVTLYLGGGTPSLFPASFYKPLVNKIRGRFELEEFTIETNPFTNVAGAFRQWAELGVTRITLGAQSLDDDVLKYLGRKHTREDVFASLGSAFDAGIKDVQVDLIFGLKAGFAGRNIGSEISQLAQKGATGVSCYLLTIEKSTAFLNEQSATDEDAILEYQQVCEATSAAGFVQFETSNFSRRPAIHNRLYWYGLPYLGLGTGAHGLLPPNERYPFGRRYQVGLIPARMSAGDDQLSFQSEAEKLFQVEFSQDERSRGDVLQELLLTLLRTKDGIPLRWLESVFPAEVLAAFWKEPRIERACREQLILKNSSHLLLSPGEKIRGDSWALLLSRELLG
ncbi:coproporphyrinogen III oxidase family protein [bacterium]|nr:coproporphyrinogen III oxidase family protein [bacterium]